MDTFGSIDEGLYINNELIHFNKTLLFNDRVSVMLPENFVPMLPEIAEVKYFSGKRPDEIYTSLDMSVNFTYNIMYIACTGNNLVQGTFSCMYKDRKEWERAALEVIKTVSQYQGGR